MPRPDGENDYVPAEPGLAMTPLPNGKYMAVKDQAEAQRQHEGDSHLRYFDNLDKASKGDPAAIKQDFKRQKILERKLNHMVVDMVMPCGPNVETVKDEKFMSLMAEYQLAVKKGEAKNCDFQPLSTYQHKLTTKSGAVIRPVFQGEVGMMGSKIICLEAGYGTGLIQVVGK